MTEKEIISKIQQLQQIQPPEDWVLATKTRILGLPPRNFGNKIREGFSFFSQRRLAFASALAFLALAGAFGFAQNSLPGDLLFSVKKMTERSQQVFISKEDRPGVQLGLASKRLEELTKIAEDNKVKKLAPAIEEFEASKIEAKQGLILSIKNKSKEEAIKMAKEIAPGLGAINEKEREVFASLGIEPVGEEKEGLTEKTIVEILLEDLKGRSLTEEQEGILEQAREDLKEGNYSEALEKILLY